MRTSLFLASLIVSIGSAACMTAELGDSADGDSSASRAIADHSSVAAPTSARTVDQPTACCGDGVVEPGEQCDDGNTVSGDGCSSTCQLEPPPCGGGSGSGSGSGAVCGDGIVEPPEQCDDGNTVSGDGCSSTCQYEQPPV
jgi:cysteine-rich repeat protein